MPKYFLNIRNGEELIVDPDGTNCAGLDEARAEAILGAREILAEQLVRGEPLDGQQIEICSEDGDLLDVVRFRDVIEVPSR